jgi:hypothetical protein
MPDLQFDDAKDFDDNIEAFLVHMDAEDAELGAILRTNIDSLKSAYDDRTRREARTVFNEGVVSSLDESLIEEESKE